MPLLEEQNMFPFASIFIQDLNLNEIRDLPVYADFIIEQTECEKCLIVVCSMS